MWCHCSLQEGNTVRKWVWPPLKYKLPVSVSIQVSIHTYLVSFPCLSEWDGDMIQVLSTVPVSLATQVGAELIVYIPLLLYEQGDDLVSKDPPRVQLSELS